jgi:hypothetical protein
MPVGFGKDSIKTKGRPLSVMTHLKRSKIEVKTETNCLAHALIIAIPKITNDPNYRTYIQGYKIQLVVRNLLETTGINLDNGGGIPELERFLAHFRQYKIVVYTALNCDSVMFEGQVEMPERIILYDEVTGHYHVTGELDCSHGQALYM